MEENNTPYFIQVVPDGEYYTWQLYVQMLNFRKMDYEKDAIILVGLQPNRKPSPHITKFKEWTKAEVLFYTDTRGNNNIYPSGIRPNILKQYFKDLEASEFAPHTYFYHDQDIIFTRKVDWSVMRRVEDGNVCFVSMSAHNYISWDYLMSPVQVKKKYIPYTMFEIVGIDDEVVRKNNNVTGGAQYLIKGLGSKFWEKVDKDCEALYVYMQNATKFGIRQYKPDEELPTHHIQVWTADMWAVLWNIWLFDKETKWHTEIDFSWPWEKKELVKPIMHNAGVTGTSEIDKDGKTYLFNKSRYNADVFPFGDDLSFVPNDIAQRQYVDLIIEVGDLCKLNKQNMQPENRRLKLMGLFNTTNKLHPDLLSMTLRHIDDAVKATTNCDVEIVTVSWQPIPNNITTNEIITPFNGLGHMNYLLQIKHALALYDADIVCILEHDMIYPPNYFERVAGEWDGGKYGVTFDNYIGVNETGYQDVVQRHQPFSLMSMAKFYLERNVNAKIDELFRTVNEQWKYGMTSIEPDNKSDFKQIPFSNVWPAMHVNMNHLGSWGTGVVGKNHHFTSHCEVCYEKDAKGKVDRPHDWGNFRKYFTFS